MDDVKVWNMWNDVFHHRVHAAQGVLLGGCAECIAEVKVRESGAERTSDE